MINGRVGQRNLNQQHKEKNQSGSVHHALVQVKEKFAYSAKVANCGIMPPVPTLIATPVKNFSTRHSSAGFVLGRWLP